jgi:hypothetical protein
MKLKMACDAGLDFDLPKAMAGLKTNEPDQGRVIVCIFYPSLHSSRFNLKVTIPQTNQMIAKKYGVMTMM